MRSAGQESAVPNGDLFIKVCGQLPKRQCLLKVGGSAWLEVNESHLGFNGILTQCLVKEQISSADAETLFP
jgi:hypothetical protein